MHSSGNPSKATRLLGWTAEKKMADVVNLLVEAELKRCAADGAGHAAVRRTA
jgi:GDPmannose 4,6-dehydratase